MEKLNVITFKDGSLVKDSKTAGIIFFRVECKELKFVNNALLETKVSSNVRMKKELFEQLGITANADLNVVFAKVGVPAHKIVVKESLTPAYDGQSAKINPTTKQPMLTASGQPIYYNTEVVIDSPENQSVFISASSAVTATAEAI